MFKRIREYFSNKDELFLDESDFIVGWNKNGDYTFKNGNEKVAQLLGRLAYVFDIVNEDIKNHDEYEDFIDMLEGVRIKETLKHSELELDDIKNVLSKIDNAQKVSILIDEIDYDTIRFLIGFGALIGFDKIGLYFTELDEEFFEFKFID